MFSAAKGGERDLERKEGGGTAAHMGSVFGTGPDDF